MTEYPKITRANAEKAYAELAQSNEPDWSSLVVSHSEHFERFRPIAEAIEDLVSASTTDRLKKGDSRLASFEADLGICLHEYIPWGDQTGDSSFWRWIALVPARAAVLYRHQYSMPPQKDNYGIGPLKENLAFRSWLRADIAFDPTAQRFSSDRYEWAKVGDQDLWRSLLIRTRYTYARELAKALLEFQHPNKSPRRTLKPGDPYTGIRMLSKRLTRLHSNQCFAAMTKDECLELISELSDGLEMEDGSTYLHVGKN